MKQITRCTIVVIAMLLAINSIEAQGTSCSAALQAGLCPADNFELNDSTFTNTVSSWGVPTANATPGQDMFVQLNVPTDSDAVSQHIRINLEVTKVSKDVMAYFLWFEDTCGALPAEVDSFPLSDLPMVNQSVCYLHDIHNRTAPAQRLAIDFSDSISFDLILSLAYVSYYSDIVCKDSPVVNTGALLLDSAMCSDSLYLPVDSNMLQLPFNMPSVIVLKDGVPFNNGFLVSIKKVTANLGTYNHPFENNIPFTIDTVKQDYCDIVITIFLKNATGREGLAAAQLQLGDNMEIIKPMRSYGSFFMPTGAGKYNPDGNWSAVYNQNNKEIIWEFESANTRGDIDGYGPYTCKAYHFGFRAKVSLTGRPFNLHLNLRGDGWGDSTYQSGCAPRKGGCDFKCNCKCMCKPGQSNFFQGHTANIDMDIDGGMCANDINANNQDAVCSASNPACINVGNSMGVMLYEGNSGAYKAILPVGNMICPDSCTGRLTNIDTLGCTTELNYSRIGSISTLAAYDGQELHLCAGDTLILIESIDTTSPSRCTSYYSNLTDSTGGAVARGNGKYYITKAGRYSDTHGLGNPPCMVLNVIETALEITATIDHSDCEKTCLLVGPDDGEPHTFTWYNRANDVIGTGYSIMLCQADTQTIHYIEEGTGNCLAKGSAFLPMDTLAKPEIVLDTIVPIPCGTSSGRIDIHVNKSAATFSWSDSSSAEDLYPTEPGSYTITATNSAGCADTATFKISETPPFTVTITGPDSVCAGTPVLLCPVPSGAYLASDTRPLFCIELVPVRDSVYTLTVTDANDCSAQGSYQPEFIDEVQLSATITDVPCKTFYHSGAIDLTVPSGLSPYNYTWNTGSHKQDIAHLSPGSYPVTVTDAMQCSSTAEYEVDFLDLFRIDATPQIDTVILGESREIQVSSTGSAQTVYNWQPPLFLSCKDCTTPVATPPSSIIYTVTGTDVNQCSDTGNVQLVVIADYRLFIPNSFTANGDNENDTWRVFGNLPALNKIHLQVFNRWGEQVFETSDVNTGWDGTYRGERLPAGVYVYRVSATWIDGRADSNYNGSITLLR